MDYARVAVLLSEAAEIATPKLTVRGQNIIMERIERVGYHPDDCAVAIEDCVSVGDIRWYRILQALKRLHWARGQEDRERAAERERRQEEVFMAANPAPEECPYAPGVRDCSRCTIKPVCRVIRNDFIQGLKAVMQGRCSSERASRILAQRFPGVAFEVYGTPEYKRYWGDSCRCGSREVRSYPDRVECCTCKTQLLRRDKLSA